MKTVDSLDHDVPLYSPCRKLAANAPLGWLKKGWQDFRSVPGHSLIYGATFAAMGWGLIFFYWTYENYFLLGVLACLLVIGPVLATGLYDTSRQLERKRTPTFAHERAKALHEMGHELMLAFFLSVVYMVLLILSSVAFNIGATLEQSAVPAVLPVSDVLSISIALVIAGLLFVVSIFALPMILDKDANAMLAVSTSLHAVWQNKAALALWSLIILGFMVLGIATALIGFVVIVPVIGYATWHAYRETIISKH